MRVAAETFHIKPEFGGVGQSLTSSRIENVFGSLQSTVLLFEDRGFRLCIVSSHALTHFYRFSNLLREKISQTLQLDPRQVLCFASHNHCAPHAFDPSHPQAIFGKLDHEQPLKDKDLTPEGWMIVDLACQVAARISLQLRDCEIFYALGHERRITYNRKGYRVDGKPYMIREEDRLLLGEDFNGDIDADAPVTAFVGRDGKVIAGLVSFAGHPATAYHPEHPVIFGEFPQIASDDLSDMFHGAPVAFLQGCAGEINAKGVLGNKSVQQSVADATRYGHLLGDTYRKAAQSLTRSVRQDAAFSAENIRLPFTPVPALGELRDSVADMESFVVRCQKNDPDTLECQGLNFPANMSPRYRAALVDPLLRWARWAQGFYENGRMSMAPTGVDVEVTALRFGDVGIVGLPCEPFSAIGRFIKAHSPCPLTIPCGYLNDDFLVYIPDSGNNGDMEYQSAFYRYTTSLLPYAQPAGDLLAQKAVSMLAELSGGTQT